MTTILVGAVILLGALFGLPLFLVIGGAAVLAFSTGEAENWQALVYIGWYKKIATQPLFVAIPLFSLAGALLGESKSPQRIVALARASLGWFPGGIAVASIVACAWFTAFTGASGVTIIALGGLLFPILLREKYPEEFSLGLLTTCGSLGLLFPPSLAIIVYGVIGEVDVDHLFKAGLLPGIFLMAVLGAYSVWIGIRSKAPRQSFAFGELGRALRAAAWELPIPVLVIGGIYGGFYTAAEASGVAAAYVLFVECVIYREISLKELPRVLHKTAVLVGAILIIMGMAISLADWLTGEEVPQTILRWMEAYISSPIVFLIALNIFLIIVGCMMDIFSAILIVVPLIKPIADHYGIDPVHLGIIFLTNLEIGYSTPPVGLNLFLASLRFERPVVLLYKVSLPFLGLLVVSLLVVTYVPHLSLAIPASGDAAEEMVDDHYLPEEDDLYPGDEFSIEIAVKNAGALSWTRAYRLVPVDDETRATLVAIRKAKLEKDREDLREKRAASDAADDDDDDDAGGDEESEQEIDTRPVEEVIPIDEHLLGELWLAPGKQIANGNGATFEFDMIAPDEPGVIELRLQMEHRSGSSLLWSFGPVMTIQIPVAEE